MIEIMKANVIYKPSLVQAPSKFTRFGWLPILDIISNSLYRSRISSSVAAALSKKNTLSIDIMKIYLTLTQNNKFTENKFSEDKLSTVCSDQKWYSYVIGLEDKISQYHWLWEGIFFDNVGNSSASRLEFQLFAQFSSFSESRSFFAPF